MRWEELTGEEFETAVKKCRGVCLLPIGVLEYHGPHLQVLLLQLLHLANLVYLKANVLGLPSVKRLLTDPSLPDHLNDGDPNLCLFQHPDDLLHTESLLLHQQNPRPFRARFSPKTNIQAGSEIPGPIRRPASSRYDSDAIRPKR